MSEPVIYLDYLYEALRTLSTLPSEMSNLINSLPYFISIFKLSFWLNP
ncbi:hypothetical protein HSACCH_01020 [Halanaerobium saccharolyticum subsp. saccharolyticum DSM 6643]|uniref:Uncharacterized protein n=1 Tax=Halanaerobium saccharolyticum subsp. saccharolyticum DSM 6643 TaxID=1293054 RepID=M5E018_9FIRM|nr:hypothetical protein HSACCH_01020 [Halanaerobium saccharolyticum subsp. saccharolyticum DSM 6643]